MSNPFVSRPASERHQASPRSSASSRTRALIWISIIVLLGIVTAQNAMSLPQSPAPRFFIVSGLDVDTIELTEIDTAEDDMIMSTVYRPQISDLGIFDAAGNLLDEATLRSRIAVGSVVLVAADEHPVDPIYLGIVRDDTIVLTGVVVRVEVE